MTKYKRKFKLNKTSSMAIVLIFILISMSIGYCYWTDTQTIVGNIAVKYKEPRLMDISVVGDDGYYVTIDEQNKPIKAYETVKFKDGNLVENEDKIEVFGNFDTYSDLIVASRTVKLSFEFINNTGYDLTDAKLEKLSNEGDENAFGYDPTVVIPEIVSRGETATVTASFKIAFSTYPYKRDGTVRYRISYKVGEVRRYMYFTLNMYDDFADKFPDLMN